MTFSSLFILIATKKISYHTKKVVQEALNYTTIFDIQKYIKSMIDHKFAYRNIRAEVSDRSAREAGLLDVIVDPSDKDLVGRQLEQRLHLFLQLMVQESDQLWHSLERDAG